MALAALFCYLRYTILLPTRTLFLTLCPGTEKNTKTIKLALPGKIINPLKTPKSQSKKPTYPIQ
jgi:hypothetical protein